VASAVAARARCARFRARRSDIRIKAELESNFSYRAGSWTKPRRVIAKVEWHPDELYPRVGFIVTNLSRPVGRVVAFYNKGCTCEQWIKEGKGAIKWTRLSCRTFAANAVRCDQALVRLPAGGRLE
jgi:Transposase DDE domain group 1